MKNYYVIRNQYFCAYILEDIDLGSGGEIYVWLQIFYKNTTKLEREKLKNAALSYSTLNAVTPSENTMKLVEEYVAGNIEIADALELVIEKYRNMGSQNIRSLCNSWYKCFEE